MSVSKLKRTSKQNLFNMMWNGLKGQGWIRSLSDYGCLYRGDDGRKCAIGHCISDQVANTWDDARYSSVAKILEGEGLTVSRINFLSRAQLAHDKADDDDDGHMELEFRKFAKQHNLSIPEDK